MNFQFYLVFLMMKFVEKQKQEIIIPNFTTHNTMLRKANQRIHQPLQADPAVAMLRPAYTVPTIARKYGRLDDSEIIFLKSTILAECL